MYSGGLIEVLKSWEIYEVSDRSFDGSELWTWKLTKEFKISSSDSP
jgi:hypothetical protein